MQRRIRAPISALFHATISAKRTVAALWRHSTRLPAGTLGGFRGSLFFRGREPRQHHSGILHVLGGKHSEYLDGGVGRGSWRNMSLNCIEEISTRADSARRALPRPDLTHPDCQRAAKLESLQVVKYYCRSSSLSSSSWDVNKNTGTARPNSVRTTQTVPRISREGGCSPPIVSQSALPSAGGMTVPRMPTNVPPVILTGSPGEKPAGG